VRLREGVSVWYSSIDIVFMNLFVCSFLCCPWFWRRFFLFWIIHNSSLIENWNAWWSKYIYIYKNTHTQNYQLVLNLIFKLTIFLIGFLKYKGCFSIDLWSFDWYQKTSTINELATSILSIDANIVRFKTLQKLNYILCMLMLKYYSQLASIKRIQVLVEDLKNSYMLAVSRSKKT
jgi:hypothetical protein